MRQAQYRLESPAQPFPLQQDGYAPVDAVLIPSAPILSYDNIRPVGADDETTIMTEDAKKLQDKGIAAYQKKNYELAVQLFNQAQAAYEQEGAKDKSVEMQVNIGLVHRALGENQQALDIMTAALAVFQQLGDALRAAQVLGNMGGVYAALGDHEQAYNCYIQAADTFQELGEKKMHADTLIAISTLQVKERKFIAGADTYEEGLKGLEKLSPQQRVLRWAMRRRNQVTKRGG